ncbi:MULTISPECIES: hypothetical protein [unclassified Ensifer]|uniref:hypothetical protein n=1 Tax=unclassified Ensifer TaxID=2633371 RepID=UPI000AEB5365|nr:MULTISPECIES: hypothetical protein [unclassified Ensifer]
MDVNKSPGPGLPRIQKFANLGPVGVLSSCCTTETDPTHRSEISRPANSQRKWLWKNRPHEAKTANQRLSRNLEGNWVSGHIPSRSKPDRGIAVVISQTINQRNEVVQILKAKLVIARKPG